MQGVLEVLILRVMREILWDTIHCDEGRWRLVRTVGCVATRTRAIMACEWITVKVQYWLSNVRIETREVEWMEGVGAKLEVWWDGSAGFRFRKRPVCPSRLAGFADAREANA